MPAYLISILGVVISGLFWRVLASIGFTAITTYFIRDVVGEYITKGVYSLKSGLPADVIAILNILGADECLNLWIGAFTFVATYKSLKIMFVRS